MPDDFEKGREKMRKDHEQGLLSYSMMKEMLTCGSMVAQSIIKDDTYRPPNARIRNIVEQYAGAGTAMPLAREEKAFTDNAVANRLIFGRYKVGTNASRVYAFPKGVRGGCSGMVAEDAIRHVFSRKARVTAKEEIKMFVSDLERGVGATSVLDLTEIIGQNENAWLFYDNGRVNKTTGVFEEMPIIWQGDTGWMHITHVSADYKPPESPDACRKMDEFLSSLADGDETKIHNLWYILGKVHTKHRDDHAYYLVGAPGTGKSVLVQIAKSITPGKSVPEGLRYVGSVKGLKAYSEAALILFDDLSGHPAEFTRAKGFLQTLITNGDLSCETNYVDGRQAFQFEGTVLFAANAKGFTGDENDGMTRRVRYLETTTKTRPASSNKVGYADELVQSCYGYICQKGLEAVNIGWKE